MDAMRGSGLHVFDDGSTEAHSTVKLAEGTLSYCRRCGHLQATVCSFHKSNYFMQLSRAGTTRLTWLQEWAILGAPA